MLAVSTLLPGAAFAADALKEIRIDWATYNPVSMVLKQKGLLEKEFAKDGISVVWVQSAGSNKALEFLNAGSIDFGSTAGSAALVAKINGNPIKSVYVYSRPEWTALVTAKDSKIAKVEDLKGKKVAFTAQTSNSGFKAPAALLHQKCGLVAGKDFELGDYVYRFSRYEDAGHYVRRLKKSCFISGYAATEPQDDFAETFAFMFTDPKLLQKQCPEKYEFMHVRVMADYRLNQQKSKILKAFDSIVSDVIVGGGSMGDEIVDKNDGAAEGRRAAPRGRHAPGDPWARDAGSNPGRSIRERAYRSRAIRARTPPLGSRYLDSGSNGILLAPTENFPAWSIAAVCRARRRSSNHPPAVRGRQPNAAPARRSCTSPNLL
jgi:hypothetical protein